MRILGHLWPLQARLVACISETKALRNWRTIPATRLCVVAFRRATYSAITESQSLRTAGGAAPRATTPYRRSEDATASLPLWHCTRAPSARTQNKLNSDLAAAYLLREPSRSHVDYRAVGVRFLNEAP